MKTVGASLILLGLLRVVSTVAGMIRAFNASVANGSTADPADLAASIQASLLYIVGLPVAVTGLVLLVVGFVRKKRHVAVHSTNEALG